MLRRSELLLFKEICKNSKAALHAGAYLNRRYNEEEFIQNSRIPTFHFQSSLPRLPVPKLEDTCDRYLKAQKPLLSPDEYENVTKVTKHFLGHEGRALHAELEAIDKKNKHSSYISEPWFDMYLKYRESVVLNHNPFIMVTDDPNADQLTRATKMIFSALRFKNSLDTKVLEPDVYHMDPKKTDNNSYRSVMRWVPSKLAWLSSYMLYKAFPLDMSQYGNLFNSTRVPRKGKDDLVVNKNGRHMLIIRNGNLFAFDVVNQDGSLLSKDAIHASLSAIMDQSHAMESNPVSVLTSLPRDKWADIREHMIKNQVNRDSIEKIDSAIFCICLDDKPVNDEFDAMRIFLHSDGYSRWFDKSFHIGITSDAKAAINFEHSWGDGVAVVRFLNDIVVDSAKDSFQPSANSATASNVQPLKFELDEYVGTEIQKALEVHVERCGKLQMSAQKYEKFGSSFFKEKKIGPDSMMQLAFQMAYHRLIGGTAATYESCSTAAYKHGRTETLRSCTVATTECSEAFDASHPAGVDEMVALLNNCSKVHNQLTKEAAMGQGFDRHLFALRYYNEKSNRGSVDFFEDASYKRLNDIIISTSTVGSPHIQMGGFAPVSPAGLGVGYGVKSDWLGCNVTSYPDSPSSNDFVELVMKSLDDIGQVLNGVNFKN